MNVLKITNHHSKKFIEYLLNSDVENSNLLSVKIFIKDYLVLFDTVFEFWLMHIDCLYVLDYIIDCYQYIISIHKTQLTKCQRVRNLLSQMISILALMPKNKIKYEDIPTKIDKNIIVNIKHSIKTNRPFYPLIKILIETGNESDRKNYPNQLINTRIKSLEKIYHYFLSRNNINSALVLYVGIFSMKKYTDTEIITKLKLDKRVIRANMYVNGLWS